MFHSIVSHTFLGKSFLKLNLHFMRCFELSVELCCVQYQIMVYLYVWLKSCTIQHL